MIAQAIGTLLRALIASLFFPFVALVSVTFTGRIDLEGLKDFVLLRGRYDPSREDF